MIDYWMNHFLMFFFSGTVYIYIGSLRVNEVW